MATKQEQIPVTGDESIPTIINTSYLEEEVPAREREMSRREMLKTTTLGCIWALLCISIGGKNYNEIEKTWEFIRQTQDDFMQFPELFFSVFANPYPCPFIPITYGDTDTTRKTLYKVGNSTSKGVCDPILSYFKSPLGSPTDTAAQYAKHKRISIQMLGGWIPRLADILNEKYMSRIPHPLKSDINEQPINVSPFEALAKSGYLTQDMLDAIQTAKKNHTLDVFQKDPTAVACLSFVPINNIGDLFYRFMKGRVAREKFFTVLKQLETNIKKDTIKIVSELRRVNPHVKFLFFCMPEDFDLDPAVSKEIGNSPFTRMLLRTFIKRQNDFTKRLCEENGFSCVEYNGSFTANMVCQDDQYHPSPDGYEDMAHIASTQFKPSY